MHWLLWLALALLLTALVLRGLHAWGDKTWNAASLSLHAGLEAGRSDQKMLPASPPTHYDPRELTGLPAPVQRYFRTVLKDGQAIVSAVTLDMGGRFNMSPDGEQWKPFTARQRVVTRRPGFVWDARMALFPGVPVNVIDGYVAGEGMLHAAALGLFTLAGVRGGGEIARGEFMRYLAETAWYPTALLPSQGVQWKPVDDHSATATLADGPLALTLLFRFNEAGLIGSVHADSRPATQGKKTVNMPWEGSWSNYQPVNGLLIPMTGEAAWIRPQGRKVYFKGEVKTFRHEFGG